MAVPKRKVSKARRDKRRSSHWKLDMPGMVKCPHCGEYHNIRWQDIRYGYEETTVNNKPAYDLKEVYYVCPGCGAISHEREMKKAPAKWIAE